MLVSPLRLSLAVSRTKRVRVRTPQADVSDGFRCEPSIGMSVGPWTDVSMQHHGLDARVWTWLVPSTDLRFASNGRSGSGE